MNHAILLGGSTGCKAWSNYEENASYGVVLKHSTSCLYYGNIVKSPTINGILFKYDTDSAAYYNTVIADVARSSSSVRVTNDGANNSSGCLIKGNLVVTSDATNAYVILVDAGNAVSSIDFNGWDNTGASALKWDYKGTDERVKEAFKLILK